MENRCFYPFSLPSSGTFVNLYTSGAYKNFGGWLRVVLPRLGVGTFAFGGWGCTIPWNWRSLPKI